MTKMNMKSNQIKVTDLDDVLENELGQFGRFQLLNILMVAGPIIISGMLNEYIFSASATPQRCFIPNCDNDTREDFYPEWLQNAVPVKDSGVSSCWRYAPSESYDPIEDYCTADAFNRSKLLKCERIVYARRDSVVYEFDLGCKEWLRAMAGFLNSIGTLLVMPISGLISDRYGRKITLVISLFNVGIFGLIRAFSPNYSSYLALQLLQTALGGGMFSTAYIFATELVGPKYRMAVSATCSSMFASGQVILGAIAWSVPYWRHMTLIIFVPCFFFIPYYWTLSESVRWLLSKKKYEEAKKVLQRVASFNKKKISEISLKALIKSTPVSSVQNESVGSDLLTTVFKSPVLLRRICTTPVWWISTTFIYYGLSINSTSLSDTSYLNFMLTGAIELPGFWTAYFLVNRLGRKPTLSGGFFLSAVCNFAFALIGSDRTTLRLGIYLVGKYGIAGVFTSLYMFTSELYPTEYRHTLLAFSSMVGRVGSIVAPLTPVLAECWSGIPSLLFGVLGLTSGILILTQPETLGAKLPDTLAEAEALGKTESPLKQVT